MADRTWNQIDARLYEEDWSKEARLIAGFLIARCPNQYGVFKISWGFLKEFFLPWFTPEQIEEVCREWERDGWVKFYNGREIVWIVNKWGRDRYRNTPNNRKGAVDYLVEHFPNVVPDFLTKYDLVELSRDKPELSRTSDTDTESDPETEKKEKDICPPSVGEVKLSKGNGKTKGTEPFIPYRLRPAKIPTSRLVKFWHAAYFKVHGHEYVGDIQRMMSQVKGLIDKNVATEQQIGDAMAFLLNQQESQYIHHEFDHFIRKVSTYLSKAKEDEYECTTGTAKN